jgi:UDP-2,4-diacetamido-2,4,6-trideoxy-beta-L-altropyranose hydrolase
LRITTPLKTLLIRTDAGPKIGVGHVMRCVGLAQAWRNAGGRAIFALAEGAPEIEERLRSGGFQVARINAQAGGEEDAAQTKELCQTGSASWLAVDGFQFSQAYCASVTSERSRLLLVDDDGERTPYECDLVLNVNPQATDAMYIPRKEHTRLLLGPHYFLMRDEFLKFPPKKYDIPDRARRILITFGGADPHNVTLKVFQAMQEIRDTSFELTVIVGATNPHYASLRSAVDHSRHVARLLLNASNMPELMAQSDLAITAGGGTCFELAYMKVPMFLVTMAKNHERTVETLHQARTAISAGWFDSLTNEALIVALQKVIHDRELRHELQQNASRMVDGRGAQRVVEAMRSIDGRSIDDRSINERSIGGKEAHGQSRDDSEKSILSVGTRK